jgi:hypothetical protein
MKSLAKKFVVFSLIGLMQVGLGASVLEASPRHDDHRRDYRYEQRQKEKDREARIREERARHEREMQRHHHESDWQYQERMKREKDHHEEVMRTLGALAILAVVLNNN